MSMLAPHLCYSNLVLGLEIFTLMRFELAGLKQSNKIFLFLFLFLGCLSIAKCLCVCIVCVVLTTP